MTLGFEVITVGPNMSVVLPSSSNTSRSQMNETHLREPRSSVYSTAHWLEFILCRALDTHYLDFLHIAFSCIHHSLFDANFCVFDFMQRTDR